jgi:hypothetical protein
MILTFFMSFRFDMQKENATSLQAAGGHRFRTKKGAKTTRTGYIIRLLKETNTIFPLQRSPLRDTAFSRHRSSLGNPGDLEGNASGAGPTMCPDAAYGQRPRARKEGEKGSHGQELVATADHERSAPSCLPETLPPPLERQREIEGRALR